jgi:exportin-5
MQQTSKDFVDAVPAPAATDDPEMPQLLRALEAIHDPRSSNELRHEATAFLERAKLSPQAFRRGFKLAVNPSPTGGSANAEGAAAGAAAARDTVVRHFGLSMMTYYLKYVFEPDDYDDDMVANGLMDPREVLSSETLPEYTMQLTQSLRAEDPPFVRNKVAQIWTDVAKRVWGGQAWRNMDEQLVGLWSLSAAHRMFVLTVLETLSDDIFNHEDHVAGLRSDLGSLFTRICVTEDFYAEYYPRDRVDPSNELRYGHEGWLLRLCDYLKVCLDQSSSQDDQAVSAAVRVLNVLQSFCCWLPLKSLISASCVRSIAYALAVGNTQIRLVRSGPLYWARSDRSQAATDALCAIFMRSNVDNGDLENIIAPLFSRESLQLLHEAYLWASEATVNEDEKYTFVKKISEVRLEFP